MTGFTQPQPTRVDGLLAHMPGGRTDLLV